ncbi:MAG: RsmB/NOP family class I SAM-dependent RNA methyltransferase, partial [Dongiaceae bacterium]
MTPGARLQAAIDLLHDIHAGASPADRATASFFRTRRYIGAKDRREVLDRAYAVLRRRAALDWWIWKSGQAPQDRDRARLIASLALLDGWNADRIAGSFDGGQYHPDKLDEAERWIAKTVAGKAIESAEQPADVRNEYPDWIAPLLRRRFGARMDAEMRAAMAAASTDLRANTLKATRDEAIAALKAEGIVAAPTPLSPVGLRVHGRPPLATLQCFKDGLIEVQDEGSQLVALLVDARPGMRVADFCAGAGGKTLAIAAQMKNKGKIVACDVLAGRIDRAAVRFNRAGVHNVERKGLSSERDQWVKRHAGTFDRVLVDAPCTGTGTWRRNPDAKWKLSPQDVEELTQVQRNILDSAWRLVKPGGRLIYATCSLLAEENDA